MRQILLLSGGAALLIGIAFAWHLRRVPATPSDDPDRAVLDNLEKAGSDLSKLHVPEFFLYFPSEQAAREVGTRLTADGFNVTVKLGAGADSQWLCLATKPLILHHEALVRLRIQFESLAREFNGEYDGWGTPVVK